MLQTLKLHNWQNHRDLVVEFDQITVLVGDNDVGKSSLVRALRCLAFNQWDGKSEEFITWGEDTCTCVLAVDDHTILRSRGKEGNLYALDDEVFKAFGKTVPEPIRQILNISEDSFQDQHSPAFWLMLNSGQAAQALNEIFNLSAIDDSLASVSSELRQTRARKSVCKERLKAARKIKKELAWTKQANKLLSQMEKLAQQIQDREGIISRLRTLLSLHASLSSLERIQDSLTLLSSSLQELGSTLIQTDDRIRKIKQLLALEDEICRLKKNLEVQERKLAKALEGRCPLCNRGPSR